MEPKVRIQEVTPNSFIFEIPQALPADYCAQLIERFEANPAEQYEGRIGQMQNKNQAVKRSTDLVVSGKPHWQDVDRALFSSLATTLILFPPFWTHEHRGVTLMQGVKYIATSWLCFAG